MVLIEDKKYKLQVNDTLLVPMRYASLNAKSTFIPQYLVDKYGDYAVAIREFNGDPDQGILCKFDPPKGNVFFTLFINCINASDRIDENSLLVALDRFVDVFVAHQTPITFVFEASVLDELTNEYEWIEQTLEVFAKEHSDITIKILL